MLKITVAILLAAVILVMAFRGVASTGAFNPEDSTDAAPQSSYSLCVDEMQGMSGAGAAPS